MRSRTKVPARRRWRVIIIRNRGQVLGYVEAATRDASSWPQSRLSGLILSSASGFCCLNTPERLIAW